jgi:hypothetical protein
MLEALTAYVLTLADAATSTHTAADRPLYREFLAEAAVLLANAVRGVPENELLPLLRAHDRNRGYTWLQGPEHGAVSTAWELVVAQAPFVRTT